MLPADKEKEELVSNFYSFDCKKKEEFARNYNIAYIYSDKEINCKWKEIYSIERYIYKIFS